jgi:hypothetical protein
MSGKQELKDSVSLWDTNLNQLSQNVSLKSMLVQSLYLCSSTDELLFSSLHLTVPLTGMQVLPTFSAQSEL